MIAFFSFLSADLCAIVSTKAQTLAKADHLSTFQLSREALHHGITSILLFIFSI
jgi:hypothetical protein